MLAEFLCILLLGNAVFSLLVLLIAVPLRLSRRINASFRYFLGKTILCIWGALQMLAFAVQPLNLPEKLTNVVLHTRLAAAAEAAQTLHTFSAAMPVLSSVPADVPSATFPLDLFLFFLWAVGAAVLLACTAWRQIQLHRLIERWSEDAPEEAHRQLAAMCRRLGVRQTVQLVCCPGLGSPTALGVLHPRIILTGQDNTETELYFIFKHELIHIQRKDLAFWHFALLLTALSWFNPALHWMLHRLHFDCEAACDERVLCGENDCARQQYTRTILDSMCRVVLPSGSLLNLSGGDKTMKKRLLAIRSWKENHIRTRTKAFALAAVLMVFSLSFTAAFACVPAQSSAPNKMNSAEQQISTSAIAEEASLADERPAVSAKERQQAVPEAQKELPADADPLQNITPDAATDAAPPGYEPGGRFDGLFIRVTEQPAKVTAWRAGVVSRVKQQYVGAGLQVHVRTADGTEDVYGSFSEVSVRQGDAVAAGDILGINGNTGYAENDHQTVYYRLSADD